MKHFLSWVIASFFAISLHSQASGNHDTAEVRHNKTGAYISVQSPTIQLSAGVASDTTVHFAQEGKKTAAKVELLSSPGLSLSSAGPWVFQAGEKIAVPLNIQAAANGRYSLMFQVSSEMPNGNVSYSVTGVGVQVGEALAKLKAAASGGIQELPAQETISH